MRAIGSDSSTKLEAQSRAAQGVAAAPFGSLRRPGSPMSGIGLRQASSRSLAPALATRLRD